MKQRLMLLLRALVVAAPLFLTSGCADDQETPWWLASPWTPVRFIYVTTDSAGGSGGSTTGMTGGS